MRQPSPDVADAKRTTMARQQAADRLVRIRAKRNRAQGLEREAVDETGPALEVAFDLGYTYEQLAELAGISRARVHQVLTEQRGAAGLPPEPTPPAAPAKKLPVVKKGTPRKSTARKAKAS